MKTPAERAVDAFRLRLGAWLLLKHALYALAAWALAAGVVVLAVRARGAEPPPLRWGLLTLPAPLLAALALAWRQLPSRATARALLDAHGRRGGLLLAGAEVPLGGWGEVLAPVALPRVTWRSRPAWCTLAAAVGFLLLAGLAPRRLPGRPDGRLEMDREVDKLLRQVDALEAEGALPPERAAALKEKLDKLRGEGSAKDPAKTLEALDHVREVAGAGGREAGEKAARRAEGLGRAHALAEALLRKGDKIDPRLLAEGVKHLAALTEAGGLLEPLGKHLDPKALAALGKDSLTPAQLEALSKSLARGKGGEAEALARLHKAGLLDPGALQQARRAGEPDAAALAMMLKEKGGSRALTELLAGGEKPGGGRGGAGADLAWKKAPPDEAGRFRAEALPPAKLDAMKKMALGAAPAGRAAPEVKKGPPAGSGALAGAAPGGGSSSAAEPLPRHRAAVRRYFDRADGPSP